MFQNVRSVEGSESLASVPTTDLAGELLHLAARRKTGTKLERRMTELERAQISERIKDARVQAGMTQEELADLLHVRARTIANYEAGRVPWRLLGQIAELTGVTQQWLLHGEPNDQPGAPIEILQEALTNQRQMRDDLARLAEQVAALARDVTIVLRSVEEEPGSGQSARKRS